MRHEEERTLELTGEEVNRKLTNEKGGYGEIGEKKHWDSVSKYILSYLNM